MAKSNKDRVRGRFQHLYAPVAIGRLSRRHRDDDKPDDGLPRNSMAALLAKGGSLPRGATLKKQTR